MKTYKDGPIKYQDRKCTDIFCLFLFIGLTTFMLCVGIYAWTDGNFSKLTTAYDPDGKGCGVDYPKFPYIYFVSPHVDSLWVTVCVSQCPKQADTALLCQPNSVVTSCNPKADSDNTKTVQIYDTSLTANTLCLPTSTTLQNTLAPATSGYAKAFTGLLNGWSLILIAIPIAIAIALLLMCVIRYTAGCFVYIVLGVCVASLFGIGIYMWTQPVGGTVGSTSVFQNVTIRTIVACAFFLLGAALVVFLCCFRSRIALASAIVKVSSAFVASNFFILFVPLVLFFFTLFYIALWILEALGYYSLGTPSFSKQQYPYQHFTTPNSVVALGVLHIFYLFWTVFFFIHTSNFLVSGTAASWYFKRESPYSETSERYRGKHIGSVCKGSFLLAVIGFIKFIYTLLSPDEKTEHTGFLFYLRKCCDCCCYFCIGKIFDWFNAGAYTWINMTGDTYCSSGIDSASLRAKNLASTGILALLQVVFSILVQVGITALTILAIYTIVQNTNTYKQVVQDSSLLLVVVGVLAFAVSCFIMSVYSQSMEALYTTYLMDAGSGGSVESCPQELRDFIKQAQEEDHIVQAKQV